MARIAYLEDKITRAERLACNILGTFTSERLQAYPLTVGGSLRLCALPILWLE